MIKHTKKYNVNVPSWETILDNLDDAHLYINLCEGDTMGRHWDGVDVYFWQVKGISNWIFDDRKIKLNAGDLLYIPKKTWHGVEAKGPRAGISMSVDYKL